MQIVLFRIQIFFSHKLAQPICALFSVSNLRTIFMCKPVDKNFGHVCAGYLVFQSAINCFMNTFQFCSFISSHTLREYTYNFLDKIFHSNKARLKTKCPSQNILIKGLSLLLKNLLFHKLQFVLSTKLAFIYICIYI